MSETATLPAAFDFATTEIGDTCRMSQVISAEQVAAFAKVSGDYNPLHMDADYARTTSFRKRVVHGMITASFVSQLIGMRMPGPGSLWTEQSFRWLAPVFIGDTIEVTLKVTAKSHGTNTIKIEVKAVNQNGRIVMEGEGSVKLLERHNTVRDIPLAQRSVLVAGGSRGIGAAIAVALGTAGAKVTILYRSNAVEAQNVCDAVTQAGGQAMALPGDVADFASVQTVVAQAAKSYGKPVDILINSAGIPFEPVPFLQTGWDAIQSQIDLHVRGAFHCCQAVLPGMVESGSGRIVNIGSTHAWGAPPAQWTGFALAKAALRSMTRSLATEFGPKGVRVNMVSPGITETDFTAAIPDRVRKVQAMQTPLRRLATAEEISGAVLFLCSEQGEFVTGADIPVCGGSSM